VYASVGNSADPQALPSMIDGQPTAAALAQRSTAPYSPEMNEPLGQIRLYTNSQTSHAWQLPVIDRVMTDMLSKRVRALELERLLETYRDDHNPTLEYTLRRSTPVTAHPRAQDEHWRNRVVITRDGRKLAFPEPLSDSSDEESEGKEEPSCINPKSSSSMNTADGLAVLEGPNEGQSSETGGSGCLLRKRGRQADDRVTESCKRGRFSREGYT
jgi:hypothetical protein